MSLDNTLQGGNLAFEEVATLYDGLQNPPSLTKLLIVALPNPSEVQQRIQQRAPKNQKSHSGWRVTEELTPPKRRTTTVGCLQGAVVATTNSSFLLLFSFVLFAPASSSLLPSVFSRCSIHHQICPCTDLTMDATPSFLLGLKTNRNPMANERRSGSRVRTSCAVTA